MAVADTAPEYAARRNNWFTHSSRLYRGRNELVCAVRLRLLNTNGELQVGARRMRAEYDAATRKWRLLNAVATAPVADDDSSGALLEAHAEGAGCIVVAPRDSPERLVVRRRSPLGIYEVVALTPCVDDEAAPPSAGSSPRASTEGEEPARAREPVQTLTHGEELAAIFARKPMSRQYIVHVHRAFDDETLAFLFFIFLLMDRSPGSRRGSGDAVVAAAAQPLTAVTAAMM